MWRCESITLFLEVTVSVPEAVVAAIFVVADTLLLLGVLQENDTGNVDQEQ